MNPSTTTLGRAAAICAPLVSLLFASGAYAHAEPAGPPPAAAESPPAAPDAAQPLGPFERLPPSAYPEWTTRGIPGGSLWFSGNMHGMPWPYYPKTGIGVSGYAWLDTGYETITRGNPTEANSKFLVSQGRAVLRVTPTYSSDSFYVQAQAELVGNKDQGITQPNVADLDDLWIRIGEWRRWDLQVGRFEAFEVYHFGMAMDLNTLERDGASDQMHAPPDVYGLRTISYRQNGIGNVALHVYPIAQLRLELLGQFGFDAATSVDTVGARPALVLDKGWLKIKLEGDARKQFPVFNSSKESRYQRGGSAAVQVVLLQGVEAGVNFAYGLVDHYLPTNANMPNSSMGSFDATGSTTDTDFGGFLNGMVAPDLIVGVGANYDNESDQAQGKFTQLQAFGALQYLIHKQLFVKLVGAYAKAHIAPNPNTVSWDNTMISGRIRLMYLF